MTESPPVFESDDASRSDRCSAQPFAALVVAEDRDRLAQIRAACRSPQLLAERIETQRDLEPLPAQLQHDYFSLLILDLPVLSPEWAAQIETLVPTLEGTFCLLLIGRCELESVDAWQGHPWVRMLPGDPLESDRLIEEIAQLFGRRVRGSTGGAAERWLAAEQRNSSRYEICLPLTAIPVTAHDGPDIARTIYGYTTDVSDQGVRFEIPEPIQAVPKRWVLGVDDHQGTTRFATVVTRNIQRSPAGGRVIGTEFAPPARDLFAAHRLQPRFDPLATRVQMELSPDVLRDWVELGVLQQRFLDHILVCPECEGLPTWRRGCCHCGGSHVHCTQLIHHYACAHVAAVERFETDHGLVCPKCRSGNLVVGVDFEYQVGEFICQECGWSDARLEEIAQCLRCQLRFPGTQALEKQLFVYSVQRLDPLALIGAGG